jgi:hypothetical protein
LARREAGETLMDIARSYGVSHPIGTLLGEPYAPFGQLSMVFGSQHSGTMTAATGSLNLNHGERFKFN